MRKCSGFFYVGNGHKTILHFMEIYDILCDIGDEPRSFGGGFMVILANVISIAAICLYFGSYQFKSRRAIIYCNAISRVFYILQYILLGTYIGAVLDLIGFFASVVAAKKNEAFVKKYTKPILIGFGIIISASGFLLYENIFSLFSIAGLVLELYALWLTKEKHIRITSLAAQPFWITYNCSCRSYGSAVGNGITIVSIIFALIRYRDREKTGDGK